jgi:hypothetical protein
MASVKGKKHAHDHVGEARVYCGGKVVTGPDRIYFYLAFAMTFIPSVVFIAAVYVLRRDPQLFFPPFLAP